MRFLLDTNVVLDVLLNREPWVKESKQLWQLHIDNKTKLFVSATTITDIFYIARRLKSDVVANQAVSIILNTFTICSVDKDVLQLAVSLSGSDFEDNVQIACAIKNSLDGIITRDVQGFTQSNISAYSPSEAIKLI